MDCIFAAACPGRGAVSPSPAMRICDVMMKNVCSSHGGISSPIAQASAAAGSSSASDLTVRASQSRCAAASSSAAIFVSGRMHCTDLADKCYLHTARCSSSGQCSFSGRAFSERLSSFSYTGSFARNELSAHVIWTGNSGLRKLWRRSFRVRAKDTRDESPRPQYSADTKIRSEVISPFRSVRMFFYLAFVASGTIGFLITLTRLAASLGNAPNAQPALDIFKDLGIDLGAVIFFGLLYRSDSKARDASLARLSREEMLSALRVELSNKKVVTLQQLRGVSRIVIVSGSTDHVQEAFKRSEPFKDTLLERGVLVVPYPLDGSFSSPEPAGSTAQQGTGTVAVQEQPKVAANDRWTALPIYTGEWSRWLNAQKKLANVPVEAPVYISLRLDGRVRASGVGYPPWQKFSLQLPPMSGIWKGPLDGMDGRV